MGFGQYLSSCHEKTAFFFFHSETICSATNPTDKEFQIEIFLSKS